MEEKQVEKRLQWLDEQRIKDSEQIQALTEKNKFLLESIEKLDRKVQDLSDEASRIAALATKIHQMDDVLSKHRNEISRQLKDVEERRSAKEQSLETLRKTDQKAYSKKLDEVRKELVRLDEFEQQIENRRQEEARINKDVSAIKIDLETFEKEQKAEKRKTITSRETLKQAGKRITKMESLSEKQNKELDAAEARIEALESNCRRLEVRANEFQASEKERFEAQKIWTESQDLRIDEFDKAWKELIQSNQAFEQRAEEIDERMIAFEETHRVLRQMESSLEEIMERLERRITEVGEMQRLAEERMKHSWGDFQSEDLQRWTTYTLTLDERWNEHNRMHSKLAAKTEDTSMTLVNVLDRLEDVETSDKRRLAELLSTIREWLTETDSRNQ
jgi:chromosome segregation ATPase